MPHWMPLEVAVQGLSLVLAKLTPIGTSHVGTCMGVACDPLQSYNSISGSTNREPLHIGIGIGGHLQEAELGYFK